MSGCSSERPICGEQCERAERAGRWSKESLDLAVRGLMKKPVKTPDSSCAFTVSISGRRHPALFESMVILGEKRTARLEDALNFVKLISRRENRIMQCTVVK
jgi:hypothetical protein